MTDPRHIDPLPLIDDGYVQKWNLIERWQLGDIKLPLLDGVGVAGSLRDQEVVLQEEPSCNSKIGMVYILRHSYS